MHSSTDEEVDVESTVGSKRKIRHKPASSHKKRRKDGKNYGKSPESSSPVASKRPLQSPSPSTSYKGGYKVPEEMELKSDDEVMASSVQKYVQQLSQGLGLVPQVQTSPINKVQSAKKKRQKKESESSIEEERWLDAIQSGKLEEVDEELKKVRPKDPKLMTARQRAMLERKGDRDPATEQLMCLPSGYKEVVMTAEAIQRKAIKSQKRKEKADEKREKDKKKTMERLLKKQESKSMRAGQKRSNRRNWPQITYRLTTQGNKIDLPPGVPFPLSPQKASTPLPPKYCSVKGCKNDKKYSCSKTGAALCSLACYKKNIQTLLLQVVS